MAIGTVGCSGSPAGPSGVSPQPLPVKIGAPPYLDPSKLHIDRVADNTVVTGADGAVTPSKATVRVFALDAPPASATTAASRDGGFTVTLGSSSAREFHLEAETPDEVSLPVDLELLHGGSLAPLPAPVCVTSRAMNPFIEQGVTGRAITFAVELVEGCGESHPIRAALQVGSSFKLEPVPAEIKAHENLRLKILASKDPPEERVDLLVVRDDEPGALVVSLHALFK